MPGWRSGWPGWNGSSVVTATTPRCPVDRRLAWAQGAVAEDRQAVGTVADAPVSYGPNLQAFVAYLLVFQHVPVHRAAMLIADLTGARPSTGFVHGILRRCATRDRLTIRGYISTAAKHRVDIMTALRDAMTHNPWTPPIPAPRSP
jgi:hypothetical protein